MGDAWRCCAINKPRTLSITIVFNNSNLWDEGAMGRLIDRRAFWAVIPALSLAGCARSQVPVQGKAALLLKGAHGQISKTLAYDPAYTQLAYPNGDVPLKKGVCTDVVIRAYRAIGIDLQQRVHEDMAAHFALYPKTWGLKRPDSNIDHRRVPNLQVFLTRFGQSLPVSQNPEGYRPGDLITNLPGGRTHIAIVSEVRSPLTQRPMVIQNIGFGAQLNDDLLTYPMTGHYRYGI